MARTVVMPLKNYASGDNSFGPVSIADAATRFDFEVARCTTADPTIWPDPATILRVDVEQFTNGEWREVCGLEAGGGILPGKNGGEATESRCGAPFFEGTSRQIRGTVTITNGPLRSQGTVEIT